MWVEDQTVLIRSLHIHLAGPLGMCYWINCVPEIKGRALSAYSKP